MARKQKSYKDLVEQFKRIGSQTRWYGKRYENARKTMRRYTDNIENKLGYSSYYGSAQINKQVKGRGGWHSVLEVVPIKTLAKSKEQAERKLQWDRLTWQNGEKYISGTAKKGDPYKELNVKRVLSLNAFMDNADSNTKLDRSSYTGKSDAQYKSESDKRHAMPADWKNKPRTRMNNPTKVSRSASSKANGGIG